ncbi:DUF2931 family protein [Flavobacterium ardleyense]|uniref:DUF2931 family protein n=1 Tax=Flavobacterium ardleyense TaxID=2038737 RepID=A0ABW5Z738_9FLAO
MKKYEWIPTSNAPELYPTEMVSSRITLEDGNSSYIPGSGINKNGWGNSGPFHSQGANLKAVPVKLAITWASYLENKFYQGSWDLPVARIKELFEKGTISWRNNLPSTYSEVRVGCAPGGVVVVWMYGDDQQIEIARFQAEETHIDLKVFVPGNPSLTEKEYFDIMESAPEAYENMKKNGIQYDIWDVYRKKYTWRTRIEIPNHSFERIRIDMFNGELETIFNGVDTQNEFKERGIPRLLSFAFENNKGIQTIFQVKYFDEEEVFNLFKQVDETKPIEIVLRMNEDLTNRNLILKQEEKEFPIRKIDLDNMWEYKN